MTAFAVSIIVSSIWSYGALLEGNWHTIYGLKSVIPCSERWCMAFMVFIIFYLFMNFYSTRYQWYSKTMSQKTTSVLEISQWEWNMYSSRIYMLVFLAHYCVIVVVWVLSSLEALISDSKSKVFYKDWQIQLLKHVMHALKKWRKVSLVGCA